MKIWKFVVKEGDDYIDYYRINEDEAKTFKSLLDETGEYYTMASYPSLHNLVKNMDTWKNATLPKDRKLDEVIDLIYKLGL